MTNELVIAYVATGISVSGRFIFMYLLYSKKSTNPYSLLFSIMNIVSSSLWIKYSQMILDMPLLIRGSSDLLLFSISTAYIIFNILKINKIQPDPILQSSNETLPINKHFYSIKPPTLVV